MEFKRKRRRIMIFPHTLLASPAIKLTIFPTSAPALGSSAFAALSFSPSFGLGFIYQSVNKNGRPKVGGKNLL